MLSGETIIKKKAWRKGATQIGFVLSKKWMKGENVKKLNSKKTLLCLPRENSVFRMPSKEPSRLGCVTFKGKV